MKKLMLILVLLCFVVNFAYEGAKGNETSENSGVKFEDLNLKETLAKATKENKIIMIDVYSHG